MKNRPAAVYFLCVLMFFQAICGIAGGLALVIHPDGSIMKMPINSLYGSPFHNFLLPGLCLLILLGVVPLFTCWGLYTKSNSRWFGFFNIYIKRHWAWAYSIYIGVMLIIWIDVEVMVIGCGSILQAVYGLLGLSLIVVSLFPRIMKYYKLH